MRTLTILPLLFVSLPALGGETAWQQVAPGVQLRLISSGKIMPDGKALVGLEIDMPENTKTYWRVPGDTGFPIQIDLAGSKGVTGHQIVWPFPQRDQSSDYLDYVYYGPTVLPIVLDVSSATPELKLSAVLGVCSEICIPAQAAFSIPLLDAKPDMANNLRLKQAVALAPIPWPADQGDVGTIVHYPASEQLVLSLTSDAIDPSALIVTSPDGQPLFGTPQKSPEPNLVVVPVLREDSDVQWDRQEVELTFTTTEGAFEIALPVSTTAAGQ